MLNSGVDTPCEGETDGERQTDAMSASTTSKPSQQERKGSFFKLIDSFALEIGTLKKELVKKTKPVDKHRETDRLLGLDREVGGLFLPASPCSAMGVGLAGARDSGYDSLHRRMSVLDRLVQTHSVWLLLGLNHQDAGRILQSQPIGSFVVRKSASLQRKVISLRVDGDSASRVKDFPVKESQYTFSLEGSGLSFADLFRLVAFCCISRDVLPFTLKLPKAIASAKTSADLEEVTKLGAGFWESELCHTGKDLVYWLSGTTTPSRPPPPIPKPVSTETTLITTPVTTSERPRLRTRTPSELECCQSNGALCFINPLFIKVHQSEEDTGSPLCTNTATTAAGLAEQLLRENQDQTETTSKESLHRDEGSPGSHSGATNRPRSDAIPVSSAHRSNRTPPPRPPPPHRTPRRAGLPHQPRSMPEKISWINLPKEKAGEKEKGSSFLFRLGSSLSISPSSSSSSSPHKRLSISAPISIPRPSLPLSLSSLSSPSSSSSPHRAKVSPSSSEMEDAHCHLALEEQTIERALSRVQLTRQNAISPGTPASCSLPEPSAIRKEGEEEEERGEEGGNGSQRLSNMSLSTDSSDSLDFSHSSSSFFLPPLHDPSPPTAADYAAHLPLSLPPSHLPYSSMEEDEEEEDEEEDEEEQDCGVGLESDQDQDVTMVPPGRGRKRRASAGALVLQRALQGHLRKMSGVFNSLLTPEKRAVRRVVELSRDKGSYFGCLVQDYLSYMREGSGAQAWQGHASGPELLQTLRQFITQMKSYLQQSSDLEPPIESLIPEEQIDQVLEKAMHKCVLKPLKGVVSAALKEFQVRSGAWQELKENLSLAKARPPQEMGVADALPPDPVAIEKIKHKFHIMCKLYSPEKKVAMLLRVCKLIYTIMEDNSGRLYGADDFLPMLTYVLAQCDMPQLDNEILYMMELLDPSMLHGEGGYYLTSAYGAMSLIRNMQEEQAARVLSSETRDTLHQWHRRRTSQRSAPTVDDFQNYLRVALQELDSGCTAKTLQVRPYATTEEVCQLCAHKFKVSDPENYSLFLLTEGSSQQLAPDTHPQKIKAELHSRPRAAPFHFVFRRAVNIGGETPSTTPADPLLNLNNLKVTPDPRANCSDLSRGPSVSNLQPSLSPSLSLSLPPGHLNGNTISV
ncbi:ras and Rab interactor 2 [Lampris incognitus]|uniref:ras and Rab interactor 2 n=1 Tax=Lampris incognitus TaxID=2546036 RepID=UPI0024B4C76B|nr:ras and Rab interactor 2 [Lampris incognitus]